MRVSVEADGGSRGNPGPAGYGAVVFGPGGTVLAERAEAIGVATNNVAEYRGLIAGLRAAANLGAGAVEVRMDSKLVVEQMSGRWKVKHPAMRPLADEARALTRGFRSVTFTWIPRADNTHADRLANQAMDGTPVSRTAALPGNTAAAPEDAHTTTPTAANGTAPTGSPATAGAAAPTGGTGATSTDSAPSTGAPPATGATPAGATASTGATGTASTGTAASAGAASVTGAASTGVVAPEAGGASAGDAAPAASVTGAASASVGVPAGAAASAGAAGLFAAPVAPVAASARSAVPTAADPATPAGSSAPAGTSAAAPTTEPAEPTESAAAPGAGGGPAARVATGPARSSPAGWTGALGTPTKVLLLRHGQTAMSVDRRYSGRGDVALTALGEAQAAAAGRRIAALDGVDADTPILSSPLGRTRQTARAVAEATGGSVVVLDELVETDFGGWEGLTFTEAAERDPDLHRRWLSDTAVPPPGGESFDVVHERVTRARDRVLAGYAGRTVVVVSHVTPIKGLLRLALDVGPSILFRLHLDLASLSIAEFYPDGNASVRLVNDISHLV
ncbi:putative phosphoglycerate mutase [Actinokineospora spheciospongiae]|nr:putative phosphoglycerate mutase [Actinokineospora spheciospongiae]